MTRLLVAADAKADLNDILDYLALNAGSVTAGAYAERFAGAIERIIALPRSAPPRPKLGPDTRVVVVYPYLMIYDFVAAADTATLLRVLHGRRNITEQMLKRPSRR
jgi:toxin ParE1/3/4